jgi:uncharacterized protein YxjI
MRRYRMKQRLFSLRDAFRIQDESGQDVYVVKGRLISLRDRFTFQDMEGETLLRITRSLVALRPQYRISRKGRRYATVTKRLLSFMGSRFRISVRGAPNLVAKGNFFDYEYTFFQGNRAVAQVSKRWFSFRDSYGVEVSDSAEELLILACTVVIDMINHNPSVED